MSNTILQTNNSKIKLKKTSLNKRFTKFLSKVCWHFNQSMPNYSISEHEFVEKYGFNSNDLHHQNKTINKTFDPNLYPKHYQIRSLCRRHSTLMSIEEENEIELNNCK